MKKFSFLVAGVAGLLALPTGGGLLVVDLEHPATRAVRHAIADVVRLLGRCLLYTSDGADE